MITITVELEDVEAAGLLRFADKVTHDDAMSVLAPHLPKPQRVEQAYNIIHGFSRLQDALQEAGVRSWPWSDTGRVEGGP